MRRFRSPGFTLIELLVVISLIGLLAAFVAISVSNSRAKSRDYVRIANIKEIEKALELFFDAHGRYPNRANDNVNNNGEVVGDGGDFETALAPFLPIVPGDPKYNGDRGRNDYFFAYDPTHGGCEPVLSLNRFETTAALNEFGHQDTDQGSQMRINTAHYNYCPTLHR